MIVLTSFRVSEYYILCAGALYHLSRNLSCERTLLFVCAVLSAKTDNILVEYLSDSSQMYERSADDHAAVRFFCVKCFVELFSQSNAVLQVHVHFPVACYNFLSHFFVFKEFV